MKKTTLKHFSSPLNASPLQWVPLVLWTFVAWLTRDPGFRIAVPLISCFYLLVQAIFLKQTRDAKAHMRQSHQRSVIHLRGHGHTKIKEHQIQKGDRILVPTAEQFPIDGVVLAGDLKPNPVLADEFPTSQLQLGDHIRQGELNRYGAIQIQALQDAIYPTPTHPTWRTELLPYLALIMAVGMGYVLAPDRPMAQLTFRLLSTMSPIALLFAGPWLRSRFLKQTADRSILIPNTEKLKKIDVIDRVIFDKTGTLTQGEPTMTQIVQADSPWTKEDLIQLAGLTESGSTHPIAQVFTKAYEAQLGHPPSESIAFEEVPGMGIRAWVHDHQVVLGQPRFLARHRVIVPPSLREGREADQARGIVVDMAIDGRYVAYFVLADALRPGMIDMVHGLRAAEIEPILLSGDDPTTTQKSAEALDIQWSLGRVLPSAKAMYMTELQDHGHGVMMVGDGLNDIPAMRQADLAIALGGLGTFAVQAEADAILLDDHIQSLPTLVHAIRAFLQRRRNLRPILVTMLGLASILLILKGLTWPGVLAQILNAAISFIGSLLPFFRTKGSD